jgi:hypothetical protein
MLHPGDPAMPHSDEAGMGYLPDCERSLARRMLLKP